MVVNYDCDPINPHHVYPRDTRDGWRAAITMTYTTSGRMEIGKYFEKMSTNMIFDLSRAVPLLPSPTLSARPIDAFTGKRHPEVYDFTLDANPNSAVTHRTMGLLDLAKGDDAIALTEFRKASQADPRDTTSRLNMGVVLLRAGAYAKAEEQYREILKVSPDDHGAEIGLAAALRGQGDAQHSQRYEEARVLLEKVLSSDAHDTSALFNMGVLYADFFKKAPQASQYFKRFLADAPSDHPLRAEADKYVSAASASGAPGPEVRGGANPR